MAEWTKEERANCRSYCERVIKDLDLQLGQNRVLRHLALSLQAALEDIDHLHERVEAAEAKHKKLRQNVVIFAAQLQAWGMPQASREIIDEVLGGVVDAPDYFQMKRKAENAEQRAAAWENVAKKLSVFADHPLSCPKRFNRNNACTCGLDVLEVEVHQILNKGRGE